MPKFFIGEIVTLQTHPYNPETNNVIISGEYQMIPPLMVVFEIIEKLALSGEKEAIDKFKCLWFSTKENNFKESYFLESDLKSLNIKNGEDNQEIRVGNLVTLITMPTELNKKRSFLHSETHDTITKSTSSITGMLTFISPVMTVVEIAEFDSEKDKKTAPEIKVKKSYPKKIAKCKWFNAVAEKFSETWIAIDALNALPEVPHKLLQLVDDTIKAKAFLKLENMIIRPTQISNRSGSYYLGYFDYILQQNSTLPFTDLITPSTTTSPFKSHAPFFKQKGRKGKKVLRLTISVEELIKKLLSATNRSYIQIKYKDNFGNVSTRTISQYEFIMGENDLDFSGPLIKYVKAYCHLRRAERHFKLASILEASELDLYY